MGLFKAKPKPHSDQPGSDNPGETTLQPNHSNHSYEDSQRSSNISTADTRVNQQAPGTTVTTTTTTTTTVTTIGTDGSMLVQTHPYDPSNDPPPASETTHPAIVQPSSLENPSGEYRAPPQQGNTQPIPPRSELRNATSKPPLNSQAPPANTQSYNQNSQAPAQNQQQYNQPPPFKQHYNQTTQIPTQNQPQYSQPSQAPIRNEQQYYQNPQSFGQAHNHSHNPQQYAQEDQPPPVPEKHANPPSTNPNSVNFSRPGAAHHHPRREGILNAAKGLHGAGDAIRGSVNSTIAKTVGDQAEIERQRAIHEQGMREVRESGFRDKAEGRLRRRSGSYGMRDGRGLERVDERVANI